METTEFDSIGQHVKKESKRVITRGEVGCSTLQGKDNAISDV